MDRKDMRSILHKNVDGILDPSTPFVRYFFYLVNLVFVLINSFNYLLKINTLK